MIAILICVIFVVNVVMSSIASLVVDRAVLNDEWLGMSFPVGLVVMGIMACLFLYRRVSVGRWVWGLLGGCMLANIFERVVFGSVWDWIPCGIGYTNTADIGILVALVVVLMKVIKR